MAIGKSLLLSLLLSALHLFSSCWGSIMMDLASKHSDRSQHLDSSLALLDVDPISLHGLASILELYTKGPSRSSRFVYPSSSSSWSGIEHVRLAQVIKKVAIQLEHIPNESFLWGLLWQTFKQLASAPVSPVPFPSSFARSFI